MENEIWRECTSWLTRCGALRPDHKLNWSDSTIADFAYTLRDGVLLCNLLNILDPESFDMKDVNQKPQMAQVSFGKYFIYYSTNFSFYRILFFCRSFCVFETSKLFYKLVRMYMVYKNAIYLNLPCYSICLISIK